MASSKNIQLTALVVASALALTACGGGGSSGSDSPAPPPVTVSNPITVTPSLGQFSAGTVVVAYKLDGTTEIARGTVDANGVAKIDLGSHTGAVVVSVQGGTGVTYFDEHTKTNVSFPAGQTLSAVAPGGTATVGVTPLTEAAKQQLAAAAGGIAAATDTTIGAANKTVAAAFGLADALTPPVLIKDATAKNTDNSDAGRYALVLAVLAGSGDAGVPAHEAAAALAKDFAADGKLDGKGPGGTAVGKVDVAKLTTNYGDMLADAAKTFAKPDVAAVIEAEAAAKLVNIITAPKAPDANTTGIKAARDVIADVRLSASIADGQLRATGKALADAVTAVNDSTRLAIEHYELLSMGGTFMWSLIQGDTAGMVSRAPTAVGWTKRYNPSGSRPAMDCYSDTAEAAQTTRVVCNYSRRQGRNLEKPHEWSRFRVVFTRGANAGDFNWDALAQTSTNGTFAEGDVTNLPFGTEQDGVFHFELTEPGNATAATKAKASIKGALPFGMAQMATDKQDLDLTVNASLAELTAGAVADATIAGAMTRTVGGKTAKIEFLPDSKIAVDETRSSLVASLGVKATVGDYTLTGSLSQSDTATLLAATPTPTTAKFTGSVVGTSGDSASIEATAKISKLDTVGELHAGTVSLAGKVTTKAGLVVQLAVGAERAEAGKDVTSVTVTQQFTSGAGERKVSVAAKLTAGELDGPLTITASRNGLAVAATVTRGSDGKITGSIKAGDQEVGTVSGTQINYKDGTTESLG
ncbi:hypothetical protein [Pelomonas sp. Root1444]|uniref:hypothetical protein n=1 Tax=Pelomonas sp. Root1444 TaxID=1736464 RepID=UPI000A99BD9F|nr:hypothetical protein [Pelomonas sp. Root1444]